MLNSTGYMSDIYPDLWPLNLVLIKIFYYFLLVPVWEVTIIPKSEKKSGKRENTFNKLEKPKTKSEWDKKQTT